MANSGSGDSVVDRVVRLLEAIPEGSDALQLSELAARAGLPLSTAHRQFSKLTMTQDAQAAWWLTARVYDATGQLQSQQTLSL